MAPWETPWSHLLIGNRALFFLGRYLLPVVSNPLGDVCPMGVTFTLPGQLLGNLLACFWADLSALSLVLLLWSLNRIHIVSFLNKYRIEDKKGIESEVSCLSEAKIRTKKVMMDRPGAIKPTGDRVSIVSR